MPVPYLDSTAIANGAHVLEPSTEIGYVIFVLGFFAVLGILGWRWISLKYAKKPSEWEGTERRTEIVESNIERFALMEQQISLLCKEFALRFGALESSLKQLLDIIERVEKTSKDREDSIKSDIAALSDRIDRLSKRLDDHIDRG